MNTVVIVLVALAVLALLAALGFYLFVVRNPARMQGFAQYLMRFGFIRRRVEKQASEQLTNDPDQLIEAARQIGGRDMARALEQQLSGKSEEETQALIDQAMKMAESGKMPTPGTMPAAAPKPTSNAKRNKARAKRKAAKKQRKRR